MKTYYKDAFGDYICGKDIASINGNTVTMSYGFRRVVDDNIADKIRADLAKQK